MNEVVLKLLAQARDGSIKPDDAVEALVALNLGSRLEAEELVLIALGGSDEVVNVDGKDYFERSDGTRLLVGPDGWPVSAAGGSASGGKSEI